ncbi:MULTISPECIES: cytochrome-c peroxidase [unclassified Arenibacter]|uniref:cytochrome-c peroxidase n=1 Tax=unclassified Arenibacter TaxID=2615047 RepID=UPI000E3577E6|nr:MULTISPECIES: cytochrome c peroxidase [unclassified Arenibacter]MCM4164694.1 cytochrome-c peroxidase [Arenibacter sp. A80]RFT55769.1 cytochrome-c peroxidase [Arenibacter sp. P308M17]
MKRTSILWESILIGLLMLSGGRTTIPYQKDTIPEKVAALYIANFHQFQNEVDALAAQTKNTNSINEWEVLKKQVESTRMAYKKIEFIFDYYQTSYNGTYINGAPLPKVNEYFKADSVIAPGGLQALDEAVFEPASDENLQHVQVLANALKERVDFIAKIHLPVQLKSSQIIECIRSGIVRIYTLGLTGYDTPGSVNGLKESYVAWESLETTFLYFESGISLEAKAQMDAIKKYFTKGRKMLGAKTNFNDFDRLGFLKEVVNPLYAALLEFQNANNIILEPYKKHAQNYGVKNIFDIGFINTDFYSEYVYLPLDNPKTIGLGKQLFHDPQLSRDNVMSCASCHNPIKGFSDGLPKSVSNREGVFTSRNAPTLVDASYSTRFFWDMRAFDLEKQVIHVIDNDLEFNTDFDAIIDKLKRNDHYNKLFKAAYGGIDKEDINQRSISNAIAAYVNSLKSFNSPFDKYVRNQTEDYSENAKRGFNLFMGKAACGSCHFAPVFNGTVPPFYMESESEVLGITQGFDSIAPRLDTDLGRMGNGQKVDDHPFFKNSFKTVTVRNVALTAPYMHNGLFNDLEEVMAFYNLGGGAGMGLEVENQTLPEAPLELSQQEIEDIITFLETLSDPPAYKLNGD